MVRVIIAGSRTFKDYDLLERETIDFLKDYRPSQVEVVSGTAEGADLLGEEFAKKKGCKIKRFFPNWDNLGKTAGYIRNGEMARYADKCIVFWNCISRGSEQMINIATREGLDLKVVKY
ncbi:hypothetical protein CON01_00600 [Bacillus thuringiensis]|uniref:YspA cpYpsA-related SLOG domain-containing protein n=1 Tax=Bacillus thuringiensis TaxID=1428 RepID=A0A9X6U4H4_BACTU|nr:SLOG family protein [Bacillus thuringiensis]PED16382.1 hypothetical protein CON01_00600 [Bacillus thuringiensis]PES54428.1 hypothetical protein CN506_20345 [Bacillus thuringiensis]PGO85144.1 hypothetical protein CN990_20890 [Bacillus thuringiensis]